MSSCEGIGFRGLKKSFFDALKEGELRPILGFEKKHRGTFLVEIRKNYLDLYFLGHAIKVAQTRSGYNLSSAKVFLPDKVEKWPISFNDIKKKYKDYNRKEYKSEFDEFISEIILEIVRHKKGDISEGVSEMNHYINNRVAYKPGDIVVIDRQVTHGKARIDLLGLKRLKSGDFSFVVIELKNKENKDIKEVFSQTNEYLSIIREHYDSFQATYNLILEQKIKLGLLDKKNNGKIANGTSGEGSIEGIVVLDNYKLRSELLERALKNDWGKFRNSHNIKLFLKTNTLDNRFLWNYEKTNKFIKKCS